LRCKKQLLDSQSGLHKNKEMNEVILYFPSDKELTEFADFFQSKKQSIPRSTLRKAQLECKYLVSQYIQKVLASPVG